MRQFLKLLSTLRAYDQTKCVCVNNFETTRDPQKKMTKHGHWFVHDSSHGGDSSIQKVFSIWR